MKLDTLAFDPSGRRIANCDAMDTIGIRDLSGLPLVGPTGAITLIGHTLGIWSLDFGPDGTRLASGSHDGTVKIWDVSGAKCLETLVGYDEPFSFVFSVAFSPDGQTVAAGYGGFTGALVLWNVDTGQPIWRITPYASLTYQSSVCSVAFSPDGKAIAIGCWDGDIEIRDAQTGSLVRVLSGHVGEVFSVAFSPDGELLCSGGKDITLRLWDAATGLLVEKLRAHSGTVTSVTFAPDGSRIATSSDDGTVRIWSVTRLP